MHVHLRRLERTSFRLKGATARDLPASTPAVSSMVGIAARGLLVGAGVGVLLVAGSLGIASVVVIGILALGAALLSWDL